jgi:hypothetical protein
MPGGGQYRDHLAVKERPRRLTVQHEDGIGVLRAVLNPCDTKHAAVIVCDFAIAWRIGEFR